MAQLSVKRLLATGSVLLIVVATLCWLAWDRYQNFLSTPLHIPATGEVFLVRPGDTGKDIIGQLADRGYSAPGWEWKLLMRLQPSVFRVGEYQLKPGLLPVDVLALLSSDEVVQYRVTLVEGWTFRQFAELLASNGVLQHEIDLSDDSTGLEALLDLAHPEGWFLPETYQFVRGDSDLDILQRAHQAMQSALAEAWQGRHPDLPLESPYELLILGSIIEKETAIDAEREQISGVFVRRLNKGMRLQTDPTVIYGLGDAFDGDIRRRDLQTDTPYNTYTRHGLPPTPIAMPGRASLFAAAHPADGDSLFFVADGKGGHTFSATLEEHQAAVRKLLGKD